MLEAASAFAWLIQSGSVSVDQLTEMIDERDRRMRLEEAEWWHRILFEFLTHSVPFENHYCDVFGNKFCRRVNSLRAPVPAESSVKTYSCGTIANGPQIPDICPIHGTECEVRAQWAKQVAENVQDRLGDK